VQSDVGILRLIQVIVMQAMDDPVRAHGNSAQRTGQAADEIVEPARPIQAIVGCVMRQNEQPVLQWCDQDNGDDRRRNRPERHSEREYECDRAECVSHRKRRAQRGKLGQRREDFRR